MGSEDMAEAPLIPFSAVAATGGATLVLASALAYVMMKSKKKKIEDVEEEAPPVVELDRELYPGGHLSVYYGSQTGTAESFAQQLQREGADHGFLVHVIDMEDIMVDQVLDDARKDPDTERSKAIFLVATYGEGEPTDNSAVFVQELKAKMMPSNEEEKKETDLPAQPDNSLQGLEFSVFGLGNRQYEHFNAMGKFFNDALERVGGKRMMEIGLGDDDDDLEGDFETWKDSVLWPTLSQLYTKDVAILPRKEDENTLPDCPYEVDYVDNRKTKPIDLPIDQVHGSSRHYFTAVDCPVSVVRELRSSQDSGSTVHVEIDVSKAKGFSHQTADNLGVLPVNDASVVEQVAESLNLDLDAVFSLKAAPNQEWHGAPFPMPISVRECLSRYCDLTMAPRRSELKLLAAYAKDPTDKKALLRMASKEGKAEYREKIMDGHVGLVDLLKLCPSIQTPLEHFLAFCPRLLPRYYTMSSSSSVHPKSVHLTVSVTETTRKDGSVFRGVCSSYLAGVKPKKEKVRVFCRESTFRLPQETERPILMVGPGTGIAPMRGLLQERQYQRKSLKQKVGPNVLYFGCKKSSLDYIYKDELKGFQSSGDLDTLHVAFSREQKEKVYVQHLLSKNAAETWDLINNKGASIFVCGGVKMGHDVTEALKNIGVQEGKLSPDDAKKYLDKLASEGKFVQVLS